MTIFERVATAIIVGVVSGVIYRLFTNDSNGSIMISILVAQISYHGSTGSANE